MIYEIEPYVRVGRIRLGMTREEVHATIREERKPAPHSGRDEPGDFFPTLGLFVEYRPPGICEFVEFTHFSPFLPTLHQQAFPGQPYRVARAWFQAADPGLETDGAGLVSRRFGVALYARSAEKDPDEPVETLAIFEAGYYDLP